MNVLMIVTWYTRKGAEGLQEGIFHYEQSMDLKEHCNVALYYPFDQEIQEEFTREEEWGLLTYRSRFCMGKLFSNRKEMKSAMARIIQDFQPDLIHAHCATGAGHHAITLGKKYGLPVVITEHTPVELSGVDHLGVNYLLSRKAYRNSRANICVSQDLRNKLSHRYPSCSFEVIHNGINMPEYRENIGKYYRAGYTNAVIVAVLYDLEVKGLKYLLEAVHILKQQGQKFVLHHIGGGEYLEHFRNMAKELGIDDICIFYGRCERQKVYEIVSEMDFLVSSSLMESGGVCAQEAMLVGKPVLGTNSGGVDSLVPPLAGQIVEKGNARALAEGMLDMRDQLDSYDEDRIRNYARDAFEIGNISRKYMTLYQAVLEGEGACY